MLTMLALAFALAILQRREMRQMERRTALARLARLASE